MFGDPRGVPALMSRLAASAILCAIYRATASMLDLLCDSLDLWSDPLTPILHTTRPVIILYCGMAAVWSGAVAWNRRRVRWVIYVTLLLLLSWGGILWAAATHTEEWPYAYPKDMMAILCGLGLIVLGRVCLTPMRIDVALTLLLCPACGYDLRAARECRCPECGAPFELGRVVRTVRASAADT